MDTHIITNFIAPNLEEGINRWEKVNITNMPYVGSISLGNVTCWTIVCFKQNNRLFVAILMHGAFFFATNRFLHPEYVAEKLNLSIPDASNLADWLNVQIDKTPPDGKKEFGSYWTIDNNV